MCHNKELVLLHVILRHGNRTPDAAQYFPTQTAIKPEDYAPFGLGQLTEEGKEKMLYLGRKIRERYENFLTGSKLLENADAWSSNVKRTKTSLLLVLRELFPLEETEESILKYLPVQEDNIFLASVSRAYKKKFTENFKKSKAGQNILRKHHVLLDYLQHHTQMDVDTTYGPYRIYDLLTTQKSLGFELPDWAEEIDWDDFQKLIAQHYSVMMVETRELKNYLAGRMLEKIICDTKKMIKYKIHLYSGHDVNIAGILGILNISHQHIPKYGACVVLEVYKKGSKYEIEVIYGEEPPEGFQRMKFRDNSYTCNLEELEMLLDKNYLL